MPLTVRQRADWIATLRHVSIFVMETLARWVPSTPEMEIKLIFGRHLWEFAQHADAFGKRAAALRVALHSSRPPAHAFQSVLDRFASAGSGAERLDALYDGMIPILAGAYARYIESTDPLMDEPSVRILERALADFDRMKQDREALRDERPDIVADDRTLVEELLASGSGAELVDFRLERRAAGAGG